MQVYRYGRPVISSLVLAVGVLLAREGMGAEPVPEANGSPSDEDEDSGRDALKHANGDEGVDDEDHLKPGTYSFRTLIQARYQRTAPDIDPQVAALVRQSNTASNTAALLNSYREDARSNDGIELHRMFLRATAQPTAWASAKVIVDFAELVRKNQKNTLKLAYGELTPWHGTTVTVGYFKIPYSLLELLPIANFELAEVGVNDDLMKDLGVGGRDVGAMVTVAPFQRSRWLHLSVGAFRGDNKGAQDYRGPGIVAARAVTRPFKSLRIGADVAVRPQRISDTNSDSPRPYLKYDRGVSYSADVTYAHKGFELRTEFLAGDRTDSDECLLSDPECKSVFEIHRGSARHYVGAWAIARYRIRVHDQFAVMPALRAEWLDLDADHPLGGVWILSAGMNFEFTDRVRLLFDLTRRVVEPGTHNPSAVDEYWANATTGIMQVQLRL